MVTEQEHDKAMERQRKEREQRKKKEEEDSLTLEQTKEQVRQGGIGLSKVKWIVFMPMLKHLYTYAYIYIIRLYIMHVMYHIYFSNIYIIQITLHFEICFFNHLKLWPLPTM